MFYLCFRSVLTASRECVAHLSRALGVFMAVHEHGISLVSTADSSARYKRRRLIRASLSVVVLIQSVVFSEGFFTGDHTLVHVQPFSGDTSYFPV